MNEPLTRIACFTLFLTLFLVFSFSPQAAAAGNISTTDKYAWSETSGWINLAPASGGVMVYDDHLEGYAWAENIGWVKLGSHIGGGYFTYANSDAGDWGVNLTGAVLSGYAWSETAGWINFSPTGGGVTINPATGVFDGWSWGENLGWIHFKGGAPAYNVVYVPIPQVSAVSIDPTDPLKVRAAVDGSGIHLSSDGGATWTAAATQPSDRRLKATVIHPNTPAIMYTATHGSGVFTSINSGATWTACANTGLNLNVYTLAIDSSGILYAGTKGGVFSSLDCAAWSEKNTNLPGNAGAYSHSVLAIDPATSQNVYAGIDNSGIYRSSNSGASWTAATTQPANTAIRALAIKPGESSKLFAATYGGGVYKSTNSGADWTACANTNLANLNLVSLAIDASGKLYAGTEAGVFMSTNDCANWTAMNNGLPN